MDSRHGFGEVLRQGNHDRLMSTLAKKIVEKSLLKLIRRDLQAGVMINGVVKGTPQGGPLSPLLSNIVLDELDKELEIRGASIRPLCGRL